MSFDPSGLPDDLRELYDCVSGLLVHAHTAVEVSLILGHDSPSDATHVATIIANLYDGGLPMVRRADELLKALGPELADRAVAPVITIGSVSGWCAHAAALEYAWRVISAVGFHAKLGHLCRTGEDIPGELKAPREVVLAEVEAIQEGVCRLGPELPPSASILEAVKLEALRVARSRDRSPHATPPLVNEGPPADGPREGMLWVGGKAYPIPSGLNWRLITYLWPKEGTVPYERLVGPGRPWPSARSVSATRTAICRLNVHLPERYHYGTSEDGVVCPPK